MSLQYQIVSFEMNSDSFELAPEDVSYFDTEDDALCSIGAIMSFLSFSTIFVSSVEILSPSLRNQQPLCI